MKSGTIIILYMCKQAILLINRSVNYSLSVLVCRLILNANITYCQLREFFL